MENSKRLTPSENSDPIWKHTHTCMNTNGAPGCYVTFSMSAGLFLDITWLSWNKQQCSTMRHLQCTDTKLQQPKAQHPSVSISFFLSFTFGSCAAPLITTIAETLQTVGWFICHGWRLEVQVFWWSFYLETKLICVKSATNFIIIINKPYVDFA